MQVPFRLKISRIVFRRPYAGFPQAMNPVGKDGICHQRLVPAALAHFACVVMVQNELFLFMGKELKEIELGGVAIPSENEAVYVAVRIEEGVINGENIATFTLEILST